MDFGNLEKSREILRKYWGYEHFRPMQEEIVDSAIYGHDTFAMLPTGGGKSICFQVPGLALEGLTLVISPLIALMQDQVSNLRQRGINAAFITSSMSYREIDITLDNARFGNMRFLYLSPERLKTDLFRERAKGMNISLIVIDEAHCISEWGHDFRPSYQEIAEIKSIHPEVPIMALTASATKRVQEDIVELLELRSPKVFQGDLTRENISYKAEKSDQKINDILSFCGLHKDQTGIVYCQTRRSVKFVVTQLRAKGIQAGMYHGGMTADDRNYMLEHWMNDGLKVMVATNAFGMGIDKSNVRYVLHYEIPSNLEAYYQEAGRAGRDTLPAEAIAFWNQEDLETMQTQFEAKYPSRERIKQIYNSVSNFLKVAIGSGNEESYEFDIQSFSKTFSIPITETYYALKILQLNGTLNFTEGNFLPTRLKIVIGNAALYKFQVSHDKVASLITLLSRSYPGIFDRFATLHEGEFCKRLKISKVQLREQLEYLEQYGVIDISYQTSLPRLTYLIERLPDSHLSIDSAVYDKRKEVESDKLKAMFSYINEAKCRSQFIANYFDTEAEPCGVCDLCTKASYSESALREAILSLLPASKDLLFSQLNTDKEVLKETLREMMLQEEIIFFNNVFKPTNS